MKHPMDFQNPACAGINTDMFYSDTGTVEYESTLKEICLSCPVYDDCLEWAMAKETHGFWAGTNRRERKRIRASMGILEPLYHSEDYTNLRAG
jgi:hypothetical protein